VKRFAFGSAQKDGSNEQAGLFLPVVIGHMLRGVRAQFNENLRVVRRFLDCDYTTKWIASGYRFGWKARVFEVVRVPF
jgi:hypothetical protein